ncbi:MAG: hypothetical protein GY772_00430, partial [bacterium]|nr:hypothetical protein [bacterium]
MEAPEVLEASIGIRRDRTLQVVKWVLQRSYEQAAGVAPSEEEVRSVATELNKTLLLGRARRLSCKRVHKHRSSKTPDEAETPGSSSAGEPQADAEVPEESLPLPVVAQWDFDEKVATIQIGEKLLKHRRLDQVEPHKGGDSAVVAEFEDGTTARVAAVWWSVVEGGKRKAAEDPVVRVKKPRTRV